MRLLNSVHSQLQAGVDSRLLDVLEDIITNIEIKSDFSILHPDYKPFDIPTDTVERFHKLPEAIQKKYFSLQLRSFLYGIYYNGSMRSELAVDNEENNLALDLENNTLFGVDVFFYQQLHDSNFGKGYFQRGWSVLKEENDGSLVIKKGDLRLHIQRDKHLLEADKSASVGDIIAVRMPKNVVQSGFYMAVGNAGLYRNHDLKNQVTVRIYFNLTPSGAINVMGNLTQCLNKENIPFQFKVLYHPKSYNRYDSGVLYFDKRDYATVRQFLNYIYIENKRNFKSEIPLFTKKLAPGLGLAEEPDKKFAERESFGVNRCQIIANGLLEAWYQGDNSPQGKIKAIIGQFSHLGIDLKRVHLNVHSEDIYQVLA